MISAVAEGADREEGGEREFVREARLAKLDASLARGLADAETGRTRPADEVFNRLEGKYRAMTRPPQMPGR